MHLMTTNNGVSYHHHHHHHHYHRSGVVDAAPPMMRYYDGENSKQLYSNSSVGDDTSSAADDGSSSGGGSIKTKRRSHRPRGCRGGRKNRKNQLAKATALLPKEILDIPAPSSPPNQESNKRSHNQSMGGKITILSRGGENKSGRGGASGGLPFMNHPASIGTAFSTANRPIAQASQSQHNEASSYIYNQSSFKTASPSTAPYHHHQETSSHRFRPLQDSNGLFLEKPAKASTSQNITNMYRDKKSSLSLLQNEILPPLPSIPIQPEPIHQGPNPYALSSKHRHHSTSMDAVHKNDVHNNSPTMKSQIAPNNKGNNNGNMNSYSSEDYRSQRIEKQRQMLANGGSLFVTSPRSFLLGRSSSSDAVW